jgi:vitamin K-dependent gamma-carboxylase
MASQRQNSPFSQFNMLRHQLSLQVDASSLAAFRILYGLIMFVAMVRFLARGWVKSLYLDPQFHFPWVSFIQPWPGIWMYAHVVILTICALGIALGLFYRVSVVIFCVGFTYLEFIDRTAYLNHYYLAGLISGLLVFMPAHHQWSVDAWRRKDGFSQTVPQWTIWLLRFQLIVVYVFAGLAKINSDWLLAAQPLRMWLMACANLPWIGPWLAESWAAYAASWFGVLHDLCIPFLLLWARTRPWAYLVAIFFHSMTAVLFPIGMFPWIMLTTTTIFFSPAWPRKLLGRVFTAKDRTEVLEPSGWPRPPQLKIISNPAAAAILIYCLAQVLIPLRSWFYPQQGAWDVSGFNFAWRVMLVEKTGYAEFYAVNPITREREGIRLSDYITSRQEMMMAQDPHLVQAMAQYLGREFPGKEIYADAYATLNGRPSQQIVRSDIDLAAVPPADWIVPLQRLHND